MIKEPQALWVKTLKGIYYPNHDSVLQANSGRNSSWIWRSILYGRELLKREGRWLVGDGQSINIEGEKVKGGRADAITSWSALLPAHAMGALQTPISRPQARDQLILPLTSSGDSSVRI